MTSRADSVKSVSKEIGDSSVFGVGWLATTWSTEIYPHITQKAQERLCSLLFFLDI
jgi:hypothetical protein